MDRGSFQSPVKKRKAIPLMSINNFEDFHCYEILDIIIPPQTKKNKIYNSPISS